MTRKEDDMRDVARGDRKLPAPFAATSATPAKVSATEPRNDDVGPRGCRRFFNGTTVVCKTHSDLRDCRSAAASSTGDGLREVAERAVRRFSTKAADEHAWGGKKHTAGRADLCTDPLCSEAADLRTLLLAALQSEPQSEEASRPPKSCGCSVGVEDGKWEAHDEDCGYRLAMEAIMRDGYPA